MNLISKIHYSCEREKYIFIVLRELGVSTGRSGSGLYPTRDQPDRISGGSSDPPSTSEGVRSEWSNLHQKTIGSVKTVHDEKSSQNN